MLNFYYSFMFWLPMAMAIIGLLLRVIPKKGYTIRKTHNFRQILGNIILYPCILLTVMQFGANRPTWFCETLDGRFMYACFSLTDSATMAKADTVNAITPDSTVLMTADTANATECIIPYEEVDGVKHITVNIGTASVKAVYDTGCSYAIAFCPKDYYKLVGSGTIEEGKFTGTSQATIADGTVVVNNVFMLPSCVIGNVRFLEKEVVAMTYGDATLVGHSMFKNFKSVLVDNEHKQLILKK